MQQDKDSNDATGSDCEGLEKKPVDHSTNEFELHFSVSSLTTKHGETLHKNDIIEKNELDMNLNNIESISLQFDTQNSGLQVVQSLEWSNDFSLASLQSNDFMDGYDSIVVTRRRTSRKQWTKEVEARQDSSFHETSQS